MSLIVDFLFLRNSKNSLIIKEAAVVSVNKNYIGHWIISPTEEYNTLPIPVKVKNYETAIKDHGLHWSDGTTTFSDFKKILCELCKDGEKILVYGEYIAFLVEEITKCNKVVNLKNNNFGILFSLPNTEFSCYHHGMIFNGKYNNCALSNVLYIKRSLVEKESTENNSSTFYLIINENETKEAEK